MSRKSTTIGIKELRKDSAKVSQQIIGQKHIEGLQEESYENVIGMTYPFTKNNVSLQKQDKES